MKVTRLKKGYRINLSDAEMGMLRSIIVDGVVSYEGLEDYEYQSTWSPAEKSAFTRRTKLKGTDYGILWTDEDRRP